jgi:hypothetical protein
MFCWNKYSSKLLFPPTILYIFSKLLISVMVLLYLFVESEYVFDLYISECFDESLVAAVIGPDILMNFRLAFLIGLSQ